MSAQTTSSPEFVRRKILESFRDVPYPGDENLVTGDDPEYVEAAAALRGKEWTSISSRLVRECAEALPLLTPEAFRYFLPAYLLACVDARDEIDVAWDSVIFNLTPFRERASWQQKFRRRVERFTDPEVEALAAFLQFVDEREKADWGGAATETYDDRVRPALEFWKARSQKQ